MYIRQVEDPYNDVPHYFVLFHNNNYVTAYASANRLYNFPIDLIGHRSSYV